MREEPLYMSDWLVVLDDFLKMTKERILDSAGHISHEDAMQHVDSEYTKYKNKTKNELTQVERDFLESVNETYRLLEGKERPIEKIKKR
jgi:hypothetical protein